MDLISLFVVFTILWWLIFFMLLPVGLTSEVNEVGAPSRPRIFRKALIATLAAVVITAFAYVAVSNDWINLRPFFELERETFN